MTTIAHGRRREGGGIGAGALCRMDGDVRRRLATDDRAWLQMLALTIGTSALYGAVFGLWRSGVQSLTAAVKMPLLIVLVIVFSGLANVVMSRVLGADLTARQVLTGILSSFAIAGLVLASLCPVLLLFALHLPAPGDAGDDRTYGLLLLAHVAAVACAGCAGNLRLFGWLRDQTGQAGVAARVLAAWILVSGLVGCELSWVLSPFLARPRQPVPLLNPNAFKTNFFEYLIRVNLHTHRMEAR